MRDNLNIGFNAGRTNAMAFLVITLGGVYFRKIASAETLMASGVGFAAGMLFGTAYQVMGDAFEKGSKGESLFPLKGLIAGASTALGIVMSSLVLEAYQNVSKSTSQETAALVLAAGAALGFGMSILGQRLSNNTQEKAVL